MRDDLIRRRERTFELLYEMGVPRSEVVSRLADEFDVAETTISTDIGRMSDWITSDEISVPLADGALRIAMVHSQAQELVRLGMQAERDGDLAEARRCRKAAGNLVKSEGEMAERLGFTEEQSHPEISVDFGSREAASGLKPEDESLLDEWCGLTGDGDAVDGTKIELEDD